MSINHNLADQTAEEPAEETGGSLAAAQRIACDGLKTYDSDSWLYESPSPTLPQLQARMLQQARAAAQRELALRQGMLRIRKHTGAWILAVIPVITILIGFAIAYNGYKYSDGSSAPTWWGVAIIIISVLAGIIALINASIRSIRDEYESGVHQLPPQQQSQVRKNVRYGMGLGALLGFDLLRGIIKSTNAHTQKVWSNNR